MQNRFRKNTENLPQTIRGYTDIFLLRDNLSAFESAGTAEVLAEDELVAADAVHRVLASVEELLDRLAAGLLRQFRQRNLVNEPAQLVLVRLALTQTNTHSLNNNINNNKKHLKNVGSIRHCEPFYIAIHQVSLMSHAATVARRLRIDVYNDNDDDNDNA